MPRQYAILNIFDREHPEATIEAPSKREALKRWFAGAQTRDRQGTVKDIKSIPTLVVERHDEDEGNNWEDWYVAERIDDATS